MIGYDKLNLNHQLLLGLTFEEMTGLITYDRAKPAHPHTLHGVPTWNSLANGLPYLDFNSGNPDWLDCGAVPTGDLNFIAGDFSAAIWLNPDAIDYSIFNRGMFETDGWYIQVGAGRLTFVTNQVGAAQLSRSALTEIITGIWQFIGVSRVGAQALVFKNGIDITVVQETHIDPVTANRELHIGISNNEINGPYDGQMAGGPCGPRIWGGALAEWEWLEIFNMESHWFGL